MYGASSKECSCPVGHHTNRTHCHCDFYGSSRHSGVVNVCSGIFTIQILHIKYLQDIRLYNFMFLCIKIKIFWDVVSCSFINGY